MKFLKIINSTKQEMDISHKCYRKHRKLLSSTVGIICLILSTQFLYSAATDVVNRVDPLALLSTTLRTYQRSGCDTEQLHLNCPRGTSISIEQAQYGRAGDLGNNNLCPQIFPFGIETTYKNVNISAIVNKFDNEIESEDICAVTKLQYNLLQNVVYSCQKKRHCKFSANLNLSPTNPEDPCLKIRKFVEISYKCRPYEFRSKVACQNETMSLICNPYSRIAIYSASFGYLKNENAQCRHNLNTNGSHEYAENLTDTQKQACLVSYATETSMEICHGRRRCFIAAETNVFGRPCKDNVQLNLKVVYTCIPQKVLKDRYETALEPDEPPQEIDQDELYDEDLFFKETEADPPAPKLQGAVPKPSVPFHFVFNGDDLERSTETTLLPFNKISLEENQEHILLLLIISLIIATILCLVVIIRKFTQRKGRSCQNGVESNGEDDKYEDIANSNYTKTQSPNPSLNETKFGEVNVDVDYEIDLTRNSQQNDAALSYASNSRNTYSNTMLPRSCCMKLPFFMPMPVTEGRRNSCYGQLSEYAVNTNQPIQGAQKNPSIDPLTSSICTTTNLPTYTNAPLSFPHFVPNTVLTTGQQNFHMGTLPRRLIPVNVATSSPTAAINSFQINTDTPNVTPMTRTLTRGASADSNCYYYG